MLQGQAPHPGVRGQHKLDSCAMGKKSRVQGGTEVAWIWEERDGEVEGNMIEIYEILKELKTSYLFIFVF